MKMETFVYSVAFAKREKGQFSVFPDYRFRISVSQYPTSSPNVVVADPLPIAVVRLSCLSQSGRYKEVELCSREPIN